MAAEAVGIEQHRALCVQDVDVVAGDDIYADLLEASVRPRTQRKHPLESSRRLRVANRERSTPAYLKAGSASWAFVDELHDIDGLGAQHLGLE